MFSLVETIKQEIRKGIWEKRAQLKRLVSWLKKDSIELNL